MLGSLKSGHPHLISLAVLLVFGAPTHDRVLRQGRARPGNSCK